MAEILMAMGTAALLLTPIVILTIVVSIVAVKRGEENLPAEIIRVHLLADLSHLSKLLIPRFQHLVGSGLLQLP